MASNYGAIASKMLVDFSGKDSLRAQAFAKGEALQQEGQVPWVRIKGGNCEGCNWDLVDLVDLVNLLNSAEIYKNIRRNKETIGAASGRAPEVGFFILLMFLYIFQLN